LLIALGFAGCAGGPSAVVTPGVARGRSVDLLRRDIDALLAARTLEHATWGVLVRSLARNEILYETNARKLLMPASNMKIVTLAVAAERLGWDYSYETRIVTSGSIEAGSLNGDLVVVGMGDPSIDDWDGNATRLFHTWAEQLKARGIVKVMGRVVGDDNLLEDAILGSGWAWDDLDNSYATAAGALQFNQNTARVTVTPRGEPGVSPEATVAPDGSGLDLLNLLATQAPDAPVSIATRRRVGSPRLELTGGVPAGGRPVLRNVSVYNPTLYFVTALRNALIASGIDVIGEAVDVDDLVVAPIVEAGTPLVSHRSPPLSTLAQTMMKNSQNLFAETFLLSLGALDTHAGASAENGRRAVREVLDEWGVPASSVFVADGSGLSRYNVVTAETLVGILAHVHADEGLREPFRAALPVAGRDGTLAQRMGGTAAEGNAQAKTGAFSNARALSGFVRSADGDPLVFSIMANHFGPAADVVEGTIDAIVVRLAQFER
jgi:D-alanyl-D-alanine carboxypeptidase/D-alanyl-D-alanine-endopeptidase (penicillin-binding protein 4)